MKRYFKFLPLIVFALSSCEKEIAIDIPPHTSQLVVNGTSLVGDTIQLQISKSIGVLEKPGKKLLVSDASALLYEDDRFVETIKYDVATETYRSSTVASPGKTYRVEISAPGFTNVVAEARTPVPVLISNLQRVAKARLDENGDPQDELRIAFTDPPEAGDYYIVKILPPLIIDTGTGMIECINSIDASVESVYADDIDMNSCLSPDGIFMKDILFNGSKKELRLFLSSSALEPTDIGGSKFYPVVELYHVTEDWYRFAKSYRYAIDNNGNPFSEPTNVYGNIKNGYGIFSMVDVDSREIE